MNDNKEKNLALYEAIREVPIDAKKTIGGGRLKGMTDIAPMWRIKTLTEQFGICGIGWYPDIIRMWTETSTTGEKTANVEIRLYIKVDGEWSKGIPGVGGSKLAVEERDGVYTDDECYKKAYTDAISVACKALGMGADVYWDKDSKYKTDDDNSEKDADKKDTAPQPTKPKLQSKYSIIQSLIKGSKITSAEVDEWITKSFGSLIKINNLSDGQFQALKNALEKTLGGAK